MSTHLSRQLLLLMLLRLSSPAGKGTLLSAVRGNDLLLFMRQRECTHKTVKITPALADLMLFMRQADRERYDHPQGRNKRP